VRPRRRPSSIPSVSKPVCSNSADHPKDGKPEGFATATRRIIPDRRTGPHSRSSFTPTPVRSWRPRWGGLRRPHSGGRSGRSPQMAPAKTWPVMPSDHPIPVLFFSPPNEGRLGQPARESVLGRPAARPGPTSGLICREHNRRTRAITPTTLESGPKFEWGGYYITAKASLVPQPLE